MECNSPIIRKNKEIRKHKCLITECFKINDQYVSDKMTIANKMNAGTSVAFVNVLRQQSLSRTSVHLLVKTCTKTPFFYPVDS